VLSKSIVCRFSSSSLSGSSRRLFLPPWRNWLCISYSSVAGYDAETASLTPRTSNSGAVAWCIRGLEKRKCCSGIGSKVDGIERRKRQIKSCSLGKGGLCRAVMNDMLLDGCKRHVYFFSGCSTLGALIRAEAEAVRGGGPLVVRSGSTGGCCGAILVPA
jgi:hypothetical protein